MTSIMGKLCNKSENLVNNSNKLMIFFFPNTLEDCVADPFIGYLGTYLGFPILLGLEKKEFLSVLNKDSQR